MFVNTGTNERQFHSVLGTVLHVDGDRVDMAHVGRADAVLDGWEITKAGWHYRIGKPNGKPTDGWVGFGGRKGEKFIYSRLVRFAYVHWPTRAVQQIGGAPSYTRAKLSRATGSVSVGPVGSEVSINAVSSAEWRDIWNTPGSGEVYARWVTEGKKLKEEIVVNAAARSWVATNAPPVTPVADTYLCMVFQIDTSEISRWNRGGQMRDLDGDFVADGVTLENDAGDFLAFMPADYAYSQDRETRVPLVKRFWKDNDGNRYLLAGAKVGDLAAISGDLVFDPTFQVQPDASAGQDANMKASLPTTNFGSDAFFQVASGSFTGIVRFDYSSIPLGSTGVDATLRVFSLVGAGGSPQVCDVYRIQAGRSSWTEGAVTWNQYTPGNNWTAGGGVSTIFDIHSPSLGSASIPVAAGTTVDITLDVAQIALSFGVTNPGFLFYQSSADSSAFSSSDDGTAGLRPRLTINYTTPVGPISHHQRQMQGMAA